MRFHPVGGDEALHSPPRRPEATRGLPPSAGSASGQLDEAVLGAPGDGVEAVQDLGRGLEEEEREPRLLRGGERLLDDLRSAATYCRAVLPSNV